MINKTEIANNLFRHIAHGDEEHMLWLLNMATEWVNLYFKDKVIFEDKV